LRRQVLAASTQRYENPALDVLDGHPPDHGKVWKDVANSADAVLDVSLARIESVSIARKYQRVAPRSLSVQREPEDVALLRGRMFASSVFANLRPLDAVDGRPLAACDSLEECHEHALFTRLFAKRRLLDPFTEFGLPFTPEYDAHYRPSLSKSGASAFPSA